LGRESQQQKHVVEELIHLMVDRKERERERERETERGQGKI
jgi:hypothetical protein